MIVLRSLVPLILSTGVVDTSFGGIRLKGSASPIQPKANDRGLKKEEPVCIREVASGADYSNGP
eukprot:scaffold945_cov117-Alexandrium_tamarense.AAC.1